MPPGWKVYYAGGWWSIGSRFQYDILPCSTRFVTVYGLQSVCLRTGKIADLGTYHTERAAKERAEAHDKEQK